MMRHISQNLGEAKLQAKLGEADLKLVEATAEIERLKSKLADRGEIWLAIRRVMRPEDLAQVAKAASYEAESAVLDALARQLASAVVSYLAEIPGFPLVKN